MIENRIFKKRNEGEFWYYTVSSLGTQLYLETKFALTQS